jgi:1-acyl-sn-glycerol-3-phosphate acyltransferase
MRSWLDRRFYDGLYWAAFAAYTFGWSLRVAGRRNMPMSGPVLVISNHQSFLDPLLVGLSLPRYYPTTMTRQSLFKNRVLRTLIRSLGGVPVDNRGLGKDGLRTALDALDRGEAVIVFPEGERSHDGHLQPFQAGVSLLIKRVKAPIVPVGIAGTYEAWSRHQKLPRFAPLFGAARTGTLGVAIGEAMDPAPFAAMGREEMLQQLFVVVAKCAQRAEEIRRKPDKQKY